MKSNFKKDLILVGSIFLVFLIFFSLINRFTFLFSPLILGSSFLIFYGFKKVWNTTRQKGYTIEFIMLIAFFVYHSYRTLIGEESHSAMMITFVGISIWMFVDSRIIKGKPLQK